MVTTAAPPDPDYAAAQHGLPQPGDPLRHRIVVSPAHNIEQDPFDINPPEGFTTNLPP